MADFEQTVRKLVQASQKCYPDPYAQLEWPEAVDWDSWYTSPEFLSVHGTPWASRLDERALKRLSFYEAVNFYCINIHGEKLLIEGAAHRLYDCHHSAVSPYLYHFLDEENKHITYFAKFCLKYAGKLYAGPQMVGLERRYEEGEEDFLFFMRVLISEEIIETYNAVMGNDTRLHPLAKNINYLHHRDEARHRLFGRIYVKEVFDRCSPKWPEPAVRDVRQYVRHCIEKTWRLYYNPEVYRDAGIERPEEVREEVYAHEAARAHRRERTRDFVRFLTEGGMIDREPEW